MLAKIRAKLPRRTAVVVLATVNIGRGETTSKAVAMLRLVFATLIHVARLGTLRRGVMLGLQEIDEADAPDEHGILHDVALALGGKRTRFVGWHTATPFTVPPGWAIEWQLVAVVSRGRGKPNPLPHYPTRHAVVAMLRHRATGIRIIRANGHWTRDEFPDVWLEGDRSWRELISGPGLVGDWTGPRADARTLHAGGLLAFGVPILFTADRNRRHAGELSDARRAREWSLLPSGSIDEIRVIIPAACDVDVEIADRVVYADVTIDGHDLEGRIVRLTRKAAA